MKKMSGLTMLWFVLLAGLLIYGVLCGLGITNTFWGWDSSHASFGAIIIMFILLAVAGFILYRYATGKIEIRGAGFTGIALIIGLAFFASTDFNPTGGDIKQKVTYLDNHGRVSDTAVLFNCYENFYKFNNNPELKQYVRDYMELPGRNLWNTFILSGDIPKSTAPRANEDFKWHTGAYEMDLKDKGCK
jgi:hypothetical protein